ncbi:MAG: hypothetical protein ACTSWQ_11000 [Candidatus Thorarchaeota archaeon]
MNEHEKIKTELEMVGTMASYHLTSIRGIDIEWEITEKVYANKKNELILTIKAEYEDEEDELAKRYPCSKCGHECGPDDIHGCISLRCPKCGEVFEPITGEEEEE